MGETRNVNSSTVIVITSDAKSLSSEVTLKRDNRFPLIIGHYVIMYERDNRFNKLVIEYLWINLIKS